jgi:hypothetical protein
MKKTILLAFFIAGAFLSNLSAQVLFQSDFETWTGIQAVTGWNGSKSNIVATVDSAKKDSVLPYHGLYCVKLVNPSTSAKRFSTQPQSVTAGSVYNMRFWAKGAGSVRTGLAGVKASTGFGYLYNSYIAVSSPTWTVYNQQLLADSTNAAAQFLFSVKSTLAASGNLAIDSVTITKIGSAQVTTLYNVQYTTATPANSAFMNGYVTTGGIVTAVYNNTSVPPTQSGYYVQSTGAKAWAAVNVYDFSHPVAMGDSITFSGLVEEYYNETEIANVSNFTKVSSGNPLPAVTVVDLTSIQNEKYEGMLIKVKDVSDVRYNATGAWNVFSDSTGGIDTVDNIIYTYGFTTGKKYNVTGVVHFEYANWIEPRNIGDIDSVNVTSNTGIKENQNDFSNMNIYPNPNNGLFNVSFDLLRDEKTMNVVLTDITGRIIYKRQLESHTGTSTFQMNTTSFEKGTYFLEISNSQSRSVRKVIVQ